MLNSHAMHCTLLVPQLFWPREYAEEAYRGLTLEPLQTFIARANSERFPPISFEAWLCEAYQVERQQDWPIAPLTLALDGGDPGEDYWLRADPVHLRLGRERMVLMDSALLGITREEADAYVASLNEHFSSCGLAFQTLRPERWYVRASKALQMTTHTLSDTAGQDVHERLPSGADAVEWHQLFNEAQMLFHSHAANEARAAAGRMAVNSVWFWGGGTQPRVPGKPYDAVWTNDALALALATRADAHSALLPSDARSWIDEASGLGRDLRHLIVLDALVNAASYRDIAAWQEAASSINTRWFAPLVAALRQRRLSRLAIAAPGTSACWRFEAGAPALMKVWRRAQPLDHYS